MKEAQETMIMTPLLLLAALNLQIDLGRIMHRASTPATPPSVTCHIATVSYRFIGEPGTEFRYDADSWRVPKSGFIELISSKAASTIRLTARRPPSYPSPPP